MSTEGAVRPSVHLLLVRHAESRNNEVYRDARALFGGGTKSYDSEGWINYVDERRSADPGLSRRGRRQADCLASYLVRHLRTQASRPVRVVTSPMRRTLETLRPTLIGLEAAADHCDDDGDGNDAPAPAPAASIICNAFYHESEGCHIRDVAHPGMNRSEIDAALRKRPDDGSAADDSASASSSSPLAFEGFDPSDASAGWYTYHGPGPETRAESERRAAKFFLWLTEHLDSQLAEASDSLDLYDAGVALDDERHELDHLKFQARKRRRRTCVLVGHGDFMGLVLKRMVSGYGHAVERDGVPHRSAFVHFNTGITELEYFGNGRFLLMGCNRTPHLDCLESEDDVAELKSGGGLKDGWSYLVPDEEFLLDAEVDVAFEDELDGHVREQAEAMRELYLGRRKSSDIAAADKEGGIGRKGSLIAEVESSDSSSSAGEGGGKEVTLVVKRGLQVVGCATLHVTTGRLSDLVVRPSARNAKVGQTLVEAARNRAVKAGSTDRLIVVAGTEESRKFFERAGFRESQASMGNANKQGEGEDANGVNWEGLRMELML